MQKKIRIQGCPICKKDYRGSHNAIDCILLFNACPTCFQGSNVEGFSQIIAIHNFNRVDRGLSDKECKKKVDEYLNDPDRDKRKEWEALGFGCGSGCGSCNSCG